MQVSLILKLLQPVAKIINIYEAVMKRVYFENILDKVKKAFKVIAPFWPLKNLIAVNPLQGMEDLPIEQAIRLGAVYFEQADFPEAMKFLNLQTIKWLQLYCDDGQATLYMPLRKKGLYKAWKNLAVYDATLHQYDQDKQNFLKNLSDNPEAAIDQARLRLNISIDSLELFLTLMVTTLPGWASYIKYLTQWAHTQNIYPVSQEDYLAVRIVIMSLCLVDGKEILDWYDTVEKNYTNVDTLEEIESCESNYRPSLLKKLSERSIKKNVSSDAQFIFCIDVRSEQFRRSLETVSNYTTFGCAGFFGLPVRFIDEVTAKSYQACPVLLSCKHDVQKIYNSVDDYVDDLASYKNLTLMNKIYQSLKYGFLTPFCLVESLGFISLFWISLLSYFPGLAFRLKSMVYRYIRKPASFTLSLKNINFTKQCFYAESFLQNIGLIDSFAQYIVLTGHKSTTYNNAYRSALDCGACAGSGGGSNAALLASILNQSNVRDYLATKGIVIPQDTIFIGAEHDTTTDEAVLYHDTSINLSFLEEKLKDARYLNNSIRVTSLQKNVTASQAASHLLLRSQDWAQVRPEWGLARNAAFIVGPRDITVDLDLQGRCFLHSYDYRHDVDHKILAGILTAPMIVAQWINYQYLFSSLDNVAYGSGSKVTQNIIGKIGVMQGNGSDLMTGLPLQSLYVTDMQRYHEPQRLMTIVYAPKQAINLVIQSQPVLQKLFGNGWVQLFCIQPNNKNIYVLQRDYTWQKID